MRREGPPRAAVAGGWIGRADAEEHGERMDGGPFLELYASDAQSWALEVVPLLFLPYLLTAGRRRARSSADPAAGFVWTYAVVFSVETLLDAWMTGPLAKALGIAGRPAGTALLVCFVLLGDFRALLLVTRFARPHRRWLRDAALATLIVPLFAYALTSDLSRRWPGLPDQTIWLVYELLFLALALVLRSWLVPRWTAATAPGRAPFLRDVLAYVAAYYGLWALADVLILGLSLDAGWALRLVPNQLYYGFWIPFVFWRFFREPPATRAGA